MSFLTLLPLSQFFTLGNELREGDALVCIDNYPCEFVSQEVKSYTYDIEAGPVEEMMYTVKFSTDALYPKGQIKDSLLSELKVVINVQKYFVASAEDLAKQ